MRRFFVPDLSPADRLELKNVPIRVIFAAESPHTQEVAPERVGERRPLCGPAGREWWKLLGEILGEEANEELSLGWMLHLCRKGKFALVNAVQYPLDARARLPQGGQIEALGFYKNSGPRYYKKLAGDARVLSALSSLRRRLEAKELRNAPIYCLGRDAEWFVKGALGKELFARRVKGVIPHPGGWRWSRYAARNVARACLRKIFLFDLSSSRG